MTIKQIFREILRMIVFVLISFVLSFALVSVCFSQTTFLDEGFETTDSLPTGWTAYDEDGDGYFWRNLVYTSGAHSGDHVMLSPTSMTDAGVASSNWLVSPEIDLTSNAVLSFWVRSDYFSGLLEDMNILISTTGNTPADFTLILDSIRDIPQTYTQHTIHLNDYTGQKVYIAFQVVSMNKQSLGFDDVVIAESLDVWPEIEIVSPLDGTVFFLHDTVTISLNPTVSTGTIDSVLLFIDDSLYHTFIADSIYQYQWNTNEAAYWKNYEIEAVVYNDQGHSASDRIFVNLYDVFPICELLHPAPNSNIFIETIIPIITVVKDIDTLGNIKGAMDVYFYINDSLHFIDSVSPYFYNWDTKGYPKGQYKIDVIAVDEHGNRNRFVYPNNIQMYVNLIDHYSDSRIEWNNIYENVASGLKFWVENYISTELSSSIIQTKDSSYVIAGSSDATDNGINAYLIKLKNNGDTLWTNFYEVSSGYTESFTCVDETFDSNGLSTGYVAGGLIDDKKWATTSDFLVIKTDDDGVKQWVKTFTGNIPSQNELMSIKGTLDGGCIVSGYQGVTNGGLANTIVASNAWLIKLDADGNEEWNKTYGDDRYFDMAADVIQTTDEGFIFTGYSNTLSSDTANGNADAWFCKLDKNGNEEWSKTYGGDLTEVMYAIDNASDNGCIAAGFLISPIDSIKKGWVLRLDDNGDTLWTKILSGGLRDNILSIQQTVGKNFIACGVKSLEISPGVAHNDAWVFKMDANGDVIWEENYGGTASDEALSVTQTFDGGYVLAGNTNSFGMGSAGYGFGFGASIWVIKLNSDEFIEIDENSRNNGNLYFSNYPNPCSYGSYIVVENNDIESINLTVWNSDGRLITTLYDGNMPSGKNIIYFDTQNLENGLYFYKLETENGIVTKKLMIIK